MASRTSMSAFRKLVRREVRRATGTVHVSRVRMVDIALTQNATTAITLLKVDDDPDYDLASDGTNIAEAQARSRITSIDLKMWLRANGTGERVEWLLYRDRDSNLGSVDPSTLFQADYTTTVAEVRKNTVSYGMHVGSTNVENTMMRVFLKRKAMRRISGLNDNDLLKMTFAHSAAVGDGVLSMWGVIRTKI